MAQTGQLESFTRSDRGELLSHGRGASGYFELGQNIGQMEVDSVVADEQAICAGIVAEPFGNEPQLFDLTPSQNALVRCGRTGCSPICLIEEQR